MPCAHRFIDAPDQVGGNERASGVVHEDDVVLVPCHGKTGGDGRLARRAAVDHHDRDCHVGIGHEKFGDDLSETVRCGHDKGIDDAGSGEPARGVQNEREAAKSDERLGQISPKTCAGSGGSEDRERGHVRTP